MKRIPIYIILIFACLLIGCGKKTESDSTETDAVTTTALPTSSETSPSGTFPAGTVPGTAVTNGVLTCQRSGDNVTVDITLPDCAGKEVSLLALSDPQYQYTWSENPDALSDIGQITLDDQGKGSLTLKLKSESDPVYIILTAASGSYTMEVH